MSEYHNHYVDIPQADSEEWLNIQSFETRTEAIKYAMDMFGADENGMICLVTSA